MVYPFARSVSERGHGNLDELRSVRIERTLCDGVPNLLTPLFARNLIKIAQIPPQTGTNNESFVSKIKSPSPAGRGSFLRYNARLLSGRDWLRDPPSRSSARSGGVAVEVARLGNILCLLRRHFRGILTARYPARPEFPAGDLVFG